MHVCGPLKALLSTYHEKKKIRRKAPHKKAQHDKFSLKKMEKLLGRFIFQVLEVWKASLLKEKEKVQLKPWTLFLL